MLGCHAIPRIRAMIANEIDETLRILAGWTRCRACKGAGNKTQWVTWDGVRYCTVKPCFQCGGEGWHEPK